MKKFLLIIICIIALAGCDKKTDNPEVDIVKTDEQIIAEKKEELEEKLIEYGKLVYENDTWLNGGIEPFNYYMNLKEMEEQNKYDISMFVNPITGAPCNKDNTRIEFVVKEKTEGKTIYEFNPILYCGF